MLAFERIGVKNIFSPKIKDVSKWRKNLISFIVELPNGALIAVDPKRNKIFCDVAFEDIVYELKKRGQQSIIGFIQNYLPSVHDGKDKKIYYTSMNVQTTNAHIGPLCVPKSRLLNQLRKRVKDLDGQLPTVHLLATRNHTGD